MTAHPELVSFADPASLAAGAAKDMWDLVSRTVKEKGGCSVALSGGRIAQPFYGSLVERSRVAQAMEIWRHVDFFWADERCVPPEDGESNFRGAVEWLFKPLGVPEERVHRIRGEMDPVEAARMAHLELAGVLGTGGVGLDLVILGMGEDGHVASLFPGEGPEPSSSSLFRSVVAVKPPPKRVTLTYAALAAAREVWVLASGQGKEWALRHSLQGTETPLGRVREQRSQLRIYTDVRLNSAPE